jgi:gas vesicle protein
MGNSGKNESGDSNFLAFATGVLLGGAVGTVLGIFLAPKSGSEMRYQLSEGVQDAQAKTRQLLDDTKSTIGQSVDKATKNLESTVHRVTEAFNAGRKAAKESGSETVGNSDAESLNKKPDKIINSDIMSDKINKSDIISDRINKSDNHDDKSVNLQGENVGTIPESPVHEAAKIGEDLIKKKKAEG